MRNIPTDLLRSFVTILDLQGYRRAGDRLGRTQPAISMQMKRLQDILGVTLFQRGGLELTPEGQIVAAHARQILARNDAMLNELEQSKTAASLKLGIPNDYADHFLPLLMTRIRQDDPALTFDVVCVLSHLLLRDLDEDRYDLIVAMRPMGESPDAFMHWPEPLTWVGAELHHQKPDTPVRIVCYPEGCLYRRSMIQALEQAGRPYELVYTSPSLTGLQAAVSTGYGITALSRRIVPRNLRALPADAGLPPLPDAEVGLYINPRHRGSQRIRYVARGFAQLFETPQQN